MTTKKRYVVAIKSQAQTLEEIQFNLDALTLLNMLQGMTYEQAVKEAHLDIKQMS